MWNHINNQADIDNLLAEYYDFHDSCICSVDYISGANVNEKGSMHGINKDCILLMRFDSQMPEFDKQPEKKSLELKFIGLRRIDLIGYQDNYFCNISSCYLSFYNDYIIWSDDEYFDPEYYNDATLFKPPMSTYVIADRLEWRFI